VEPSVDRNFGSTHEKKVLWSSHFLGIFGRVKRKSLGVDGIDGLDGNTTDNDLYGLVSWGNLKPETHGFLPLNMGVSG